MSFTIKYSNDYVFSPKLISENGKRVVIVGSIVSFEDDGDAIIDANSPDTSAYDYKPVRVGNMDTFVNLYGTDNDLYYAYKSIRYTGVDTVEIVSVPYKISAWDSDTTIKKDRLRFKNNLAYAIQSLYEQLDFDICVVTSMNLQDDYDVVTNMVQSEVFEVSSKLCLIKAKKKSSSETTVDWNTNLKEKLDIVTANTVYSMYNICVVVDNVAYNPITIAKKAQQDYIDNMQRTYQSIDYDHIDICAYTAGLTISNILAHPSMQYTIFNNITHTVNDDRVAYFRNNAIRGVIISNFSTLQTNFDTKIALYSAINVYRMSVILSELKDNLGPLIGNPISTAKSTNDKLYVETAVSTVLKKYLALQIVKDYDFSVIINQLSAMCSVTINMTLTHNLEQVAIVNTIGVG